MVTEIYNQRDLNKLRDLSGDFVLKRDINIRGEWEPIGSNLESFTGTLDGNGYKISGVEINTTGLTDYAGFFAQMEDSEVKNLGLSVDIYTEAHYAGGLVGQAGDPDGPGVGIENVYVEGEIVADLDISFASAYGGIVGRHRQDDTEAQGTYVKNSAFNGSMDVEIVPDEDAIRGRTGGITGSLSVGDINNCYAIGSIDSNGDMVGGIAGGRFLAATNLPEITNVYSAVELYGREDCEDCVGMLVSQDDPYRSDYLEGYYNDDLGDWGSAEESVGLETDQMKGTENPPNFMERLDFSESGEWATREDGYPTLKWMKEVDIFRNVPSALRGGYSSKRLSVDRNSHGGSKKTSMRM